MITVYKYPIGTMELPRGAKVLSAGIQDDAFFIWVQVDDAETTEFRQFEVYGTGWEIPFPQNELAFISTVHRDGWVWHVFEILDAFEDQE